MYRPPAPIEFTLDRRNFGLPENRYTVKAIVTETFLAGARPDHARRHLLGDQRRNEAAGTVHAEVHGSFRWR
ncbi:hypothetical protein GCM10010199_11910 [Dactylosporangium roseum]